MYKYDATPPMTISLALALEMLRVLIRCVVEAPEAVDIPDKARAVLRSNAVTYSGAYVGSFSDGDDPDTDEPEAEAFIAAEKIAMQMFNEIIYGVGEIGCSTVPGIWCRSEDGKWAMDMIRAEAGKPPSWATASVPVRTEGSEAAVAEKLARSVLTTFTRILPVKPPDQYLLTIYFEDADAAERFRAKLVPYLRADGSPHPFYRLP